LASRLRDILLLRTTGLAWVGLAVMAIGVSLELAAGPNTLFHAVAITGWLAGAVGVVDRFLRRLRI
jgi:hypothetical protein